MQQRTSAPAWQRTNRPSPPERTLQESFLPDTHRWNAENLETMDGKSLWEISLVP